MSNVCMVSFWRNDGARKLHQRAEHLLAKDDVARWLWIVGDSGDNTANELEQYSADVHVIETAQGDRLTRLSQTANYALQQINDDDDYVMIHESDLVTPQDIATRFLAHAEAGRCPIAGWPVLHLPIGTVFYDVWAYRANGTHFRNVEPYHPVYQPDHPFEIDSVGSCWMFDARDKLTVTSRACVEMCDQLRNEYGRRIWVDPTIIIEQPRDLWSAAVAIRD